MTTQPNVTTLGGVPITSITEKPTRFSMLLWGQAKSGKTTLAATAPGKKLWINFDPDGTASLFGRDDVDVVDYSMEKHTTIIPKLLNDDPLNLGEFLKTSDHQTVVLDSITFLLPLITNHATWKKNLLPEEPGQRGYSVRNNWANQIIKGIARVVQERGKNFIMIAHEAAPDRDDKGNVIQIGMNLSDALATGLSALPSEVWHVRDDGGKRYIAVRPCRQRSPMGSRMFISGDQPEFQWKYNAMTRTGEGINDWFQKWVSSGQKLSLPV